MKHLIYFVRILEDMFLTWLKKTRILFLYHRISLQFERVSGSISPLGKSTSNI